MGTSVRLSAFFIPSPVSRIGTNGGRIPGFAIEGKPHPGNPESPVQRDDGAGLGLKRFGRSARSGEFQDHMKKTQTQDAEGAQSIIYCEKRHARRPDPYEAHPMPQLEVAVPTDQVGLDKPVQVVVNVGERDEDLQAKEGLIPERKTCKSSLRVALSSALWREWNPLEA